MRLWMRTLKMELLRLCVAECCKVILRMVMLFVVSAIATVVQIHGFKFS